MLLRVVLENAYLVPSGPSTWGWGMGGAVGAQPWVKLSGFRHSKNPLLPCELEEIEQAFKFYF